MRSGGMIYRFGNSVDGKSKSVMHPDVRSIVSDTRSVEKEPPGILSEPQSVEAERRSEQKASPGCIPEV